MSDSEKSVYEAKGEAFAEKIGYLPQLLAEGYHGMMDYFLTNCRATQDDSKKTIESLRAKKEEYKNELTKKGNESKALDSQLSILKEKEKNLQEELRSAEEKFKSEQEAIKNKIDNIERTHKEDVNQLDSKPNGRLYEIFLKSIFFMITISVFMFYWAAWYNGFYIDTSSDIIKNASDNNGHVFISILNPFFIAEALDGQNYYGLILTLSLTAFPLGVSYIFHRGIHDVGMKGSVDYLELLSIKKHGYILLAFMISLLLDILLGFKIVSELLQWKDHMSDDFIYEWYKVFLDMSFYLIMIVCFMGYYVWGHFFLKILHLNDSEYALQEKLLQHKYSIDEIAQKQKEMIDQLKRRLSENDEKANNVMANIELIKNDFHSLTAKIASLDEAIGSISEKIVLNKTEFTAAINQFFHGFIAACNKKVCQADLKKFQDEVLEYQNKKNSFIESILEDKRYVVI